MLGDALRQLGSWAVGFVTETAQVFHLALLAAERTFIGPFRGEAVRWKETGIQFLRAGNESLPLVTLISVLVGMILALQSAYQLRQLGAIELTADLVAVSVTRELAPLLTAILVAGRVGSAITAELATMKVSQEIDALTVMGLDPVPFLVVPRLIGLVVALPCITLCAELAGILGGCGVAVSALGLGAPGYLSDSLDALELEDLWGGTLKAFAFSGIIGLVGCHQGLSTEGGANEVGRSTTTSVVASIVLIIVADLYVTALLYAG